MNECKIIDCPYSEKGYITKVDGMEMCHGLVCEHYSSTQIDNKETDK